MSQDHSGRLRPARIDDFQRLLPLWELLFDESDSPTETAWKAHAREWFRKNVDDGAHARIPVIDVDGAVVATAVGTVEIGIPNPQCTKGRVVRLANVVVLPAHRGHGYGTELVRDVIAWAETVVGADRVDLSATPDGQRIYEKLGFVLTSAPRMKLVL